MCKEAELGVYMDFMGCKLHAPRVPVCLALSLLSHCLCLPQSWTCSE